MLELNQHQLNAINKLRKGSILNGGVGSGKTRTSLAYYLKVCEGKININGVGEFEPMKNPKDLYVITTARKRDSLDWIEELMPFMLHSGYNENNKVNIVIDSWNNIKKYEMVNDAFFILDEQRLVGKGQWVKSFLKLSKVNHWILLTATPGDTWSDYLPVFLANGFYKNKTAFSTEHCIYQRNISFPVITGYRGEAKLQFFKDKILVEMPYMFNLPKTVEYITCGYDKEKYNLVNKSRWNVFNDKPIENASEFCYTLRRIPNSHESRIQKVIDIYNIHKKVIVFYNYDYELELLRQIKNITIAEWNGHKHEEVPETDEWLYLVQYTAGAEAWNCITTNVILFYSLNYSYKIMVQAAGRTNRMNTKFKELIYYLLISNTKIDKSIRYCLKNKRNFNVRKF